MPKINYIQVKRQLFKARRKLGKERERQGENAVIISRKNKGLLIKLDLSKVENLDFLYKKLMQKYPNNTIKGYLSKKGIDTLTVFMTRQLTRGLKKNNLLNKIILFKFEIKKIKISVSENEANFNKLILDYFVEMLESQPKKMSENNKLKSAIYEIDNDFKIIKSNFNSLNRAVDNHAKLIYQQTINSLGESSYHDPVWHESVNILTALNANLSLFEKKILKK